MDILISEQEGVRYLHFGSQWVQGAMRVARPWSLELEYTREMMMPLLLRDDTDWPKRVLLIGLGAGSLAKFLYRHRPKSTLTVVEIEPSVFYAAQMHFKFPEPSLQLRVEFAEGAEFLNQSKNHYDLIMVDGFDENAKVGALNSTPFYQTARAHLSHNGILVCNLLSRQKDFLQSIKRLQDAFDGRAMALSSSDSGNVVAFAAEGDAIDMSLQALKDKADQLKAQTGLNLKKTISRLQQQQLSQRDRFEL